MCAHVYGMDLKKGNAKRYFNSAKQNSRARISLIDKHKVLTKNGKRANREGHNQGREDR